MTIVQAPAPVSALGDAMRQQLPLPAGDREAREERRLLRRIEIKEAVRK